MLINELQCLSSEANNHLASQEILRLLWNLKIHYRSNKIPSLVLVLSQMNPIHTFPPSFTKMHSSIILPSTLRFSE